MKSKIRYAASAFLIPPFLLILTILRLVLPAKFVSRSLPERKPRLLWGCTPIANIKYSSRAMSRIGYHSRTFVPTFYAIGDKQDYDLYRNEIFAMYKWLPKHLVALIEPYLSFLYLLRHFDIFHYFFDGGILAGTPLRYLEIQLLHCFRKRVVAMPYGADVHDLQGMRNNVYKFGQIYHYGRRASKNRKSIRSWIDYFSTYADFCFTSINFDSLYRWDILPVSYISVDTDYWTPSAEHAPMHDGKNGPVLIAHSPNHRIIKGTDYLIAAIERLKTEGYQIEFFLLEKMKNTEVRRILEQSDILVELLICGYGLSGMEGLALGKPVISNFQTDTSVLRYYSYMDECPIVQASIDTIYEKLKWLVENPEIRADIGKKSRRYAEKYHSGLSQQIMWGQIYKKIWHGEDVDLMMLYHPLLGNYSRLYDEAVNDASGVEPKC